MFRDEKPEELKKNQKIKSYIQIEIKILVRTEIQLELYH